MRKYLLMIVLLALHTRLHAQHDMSNMPGMKHDKVDDDEKEEVNEEDAEDIYHKIMKMGNMSSARSRSLPMTRDGSGTSWQPDAAPMYGYMTHAKKWMFMFHGDIFLRYDHQNFNNDGARGNSEKFDAPDMLMAMAQRPIGKKGVLHINTMFSTDALIAGGSGYPLLFQTGESWQGQPLVDRQHPHDLFSELSASYAYSFTRKTDISLYVGYPGEPALGPVTFMHRSSGGFMPDAPIGHHWQDATHITFGVATLGFRYGHFKLEGSSFTGREPDENRYDFDQPLFDSWSGRLSYNPSQRWSFQASHGFIKSPEALRPDEDIDRTTASAAYVLPINHDKYLSATALWGQNESNVTNASNSALLEATLKLNRLALYTRYEWIQKSNEELNIVGMFYSEPYVQHNINAFTLGAGYDLFNLGYIMVAAGAQITMDHAADLAYLYGDNPLSCEVYLHIYPTRMR
jgi:hypothetical protein